MFIKARKAALNNQRSEQKVKMDNVRMTLQSSSFSTEITNLHHQMALPVKR